MSRPTQDITFAIAGQRLYFDAPEGRPSSVTSGQVFRWDFSDDEPDPDALSGAPAVEASPNTTTDDDAGQSQADQRRIPVASTAGAAEDRQLLLIGLDGRREWVDVAAVVAGDAVKARSPLHNDYAAGAALVSTRISVALSDAWVANLNNLEDVGANPTHRVRWVYVVDSVTYVADSYFQLARYRGAAAHGVRPNDVEDLRPGWLSNLPIDYRADQGARLIARAAKSVKVDLKKIEVDDNALADGEIVDELICYRTIALTEYTRFLDSPDTGPERYQAADKKYGELLDALARLTPKEPQRDVTGAAAPPAPVQMTVR